MSLSIEGMTRIIRDLGREIARSLPARNLVIINAHGGNRGILEALAQDLRGDFRLNVCILHPTTWADVNAASKTPEIHGGKNETSMMLAAAPHLVRTDQIVKLQGAPRADAVRATILDPSVTWPWTTDEKAIAENGVIGDVKSASAEFGEQLLEKIAEAAGGVLKQLLERQQLSRG
jgi:creatinine amidohydrolase/Fe(II)-dependent formamide hydrolase-like protein